MVSTLKRIFIILSTLAAIGSMSNALAQAPGGFTTYTVPAGSNSAGGSGTQSGLTKTFLMAFDGSAPYTIPEAAPCLRGGVNVFDIPTCNQISTCDHPSVAGAPSAPLGTTMYRHEDQ